jgi:hypothetical protein
VNDLFANNQQTYAYSIEWLGSLPDREQIAKRVSPLTYVRPGLPPILMMQGNADNASLLILSAQTERFDQQSNPRMLNEN